STARDASKVALAYLCARLRHGGFSLLDTQFVTDHLRQFGTIEIDRTEFHGRLEKALAHKADFHALPDDAPPSRILDILLAPGERAGPLCSPAPWAPRGAVHPRVGFALRRAGGRAMGERGTLTPPAWRDAGAAGTHRSPFGPRSPARRASP